MKSKTSIYISVISILFSIIAICFAWKSLENYKIDIIGVVIGISGLIVTATIGWQIYNAIQLNSLIKEFDSRMEREIDDYNHTVTGLFIQMQTMQDYLKGNMYEWALEGFMRAIEEANKGKRKEIVEGIISFLYRIKDDKENLNANVFIIQGQKDRYLGIINNVRGLYAEGIVDFIKSLPER